MDVRSAQLFRGEWIALSNLPLVSRSVCVSVHGLRFPIFFMM